MPNRPNDHRQVKSTFRELMIDPKRTKESVKSDGNVLAILFWDMMAAHGIKPSTWEVMMDRYYKRKYGSDDIQKISQEKTNLQRALSKNQLTFKRFQTALEILGPKSITYTVGLDYETGVAYQHKVKVRNRTANPATRDTRDAED